LISSGSGAVTGVCDVTDCIGPMTADEYRRNAVKAGHRRGEAELGYYRNTYAWVLANPRHLKKPVSYKHPSGAVIWVTLDMNVARVMRKQL